MTYSTVDDGLALLGRVGWFHRPLDVQAMQRAARGLLGEHDFSAFRGAQCQSKTPVRTMHEALVERRENLVVFTFRANAFLHHMVRNLAGTLLLVGRGDRDPGWVATVLEGRDRALAGPTAAPQGLYFAGVEYPPEFGLPSYKLQRLRSGAPQ